MRRYDEYALTSDDTGTPETFNSRYKDIDNRLHSMEELRPEIEALQRTLVAQAAGRIDEVILPALDYIQTIQQGGFLVAGIADETAVAFEEGVVSFAIDQSLKSIFQPTPFVALVRGSTSEDWAVGQATSYDAETGILTLDIVAVSGEAGPHEDVIVSATSGSVQAQIAFLADTRAARDLARDWAEKANSEDVDGVGTRSAKHHAGAAAASASTAVSAAGTATSAAGVATTKAGEAQTFRNQAEGFAGAAAASALAAATFDPASFYTKTEIDEAFSELGTAAGLDVGTGANEVVQLDDDGKLPALDGSQLTGLDAGGWEQIGSAITMSGSSVTINSLPQDYDDLMFVFSGVSHDNGSGRFFNVNVSNDNGSTWTVGSTPATVGTGYSAAELMYGILICENYADDQGHLRANLDAVSSALGLFNLFANLRYYMTRHVGGMDAIRFVMSGGNFDAGTVTVYGR